MDWPNKSKLQVPTLGPANQFFFGNLTLQLCPTHEYFVEELPITRVHSSAD